jgi:c-di-GMP-binding flagellar brake protein YcgR
MDMLIETMRATVRAALQAVESSCGWHLRVEQITQIPERDFPFELTAAAHYPVGPLRRLIVGCDRELALHVSKRNLGEKGQAEAEAMALPGFQLLCETMRAGLGEELASQEAQSLLVQDPEQYRAPAGRTRNFYVYLPTPAGDLHLVLDLSRRQHENLHNFRGVDNYRGQPRGLIIEPAGRGIEAPEQIARILAGVRQREETVMIRLEEEGMDARLHHATVLDVAPEGKGGALALTSPCLLSSDYTFARGRKLTVVLLYEDGVLQFQSPIATVSHLEVDAGMHLPVLTVQAPTCLEPGQRREAFRIVPPIRLLGQIRSLNAAGSKKAQSRALSIAVLDLSSTGARVALAENTLLSSFRWGCEVVCSLRLPDAYGVAEVKGVVQRILLYPDQKRQRKAHLGIEFVKGDEDFDRGLDKVCRYVADQQREALEGRTEFVTNSY